MSIVHAKDKNIMSRDLVANMSDFHSVAPQNDESSSLLYTNEEGIYIEYRDGEFVVTDVRYMDHGDDGGIEVYLATTLHDAIRAANCWQSTMNAFPIPVRRALFREKLGNIQS